MKGYTYILKCADGHYYTGSTTDLERRIVQHQNGEGANYTRKRLPVKLVYYEEHQRIDTAFFREKQIQDWSRKRSKHSLTTLSRKCPYCQKITRNTESGKMMSPSGG